MSWNEVSRSNTIIDAPKIIGAFVSIILCLGIAYICLQQDIETGELILAVVGYALIGLATLGVIICVVNVKSFVIDVENDTCYVTRRWFQR